MSATSPTSRPGRAGPTWRPSSTWPLAASSVVRSPITCALNSLKTPSPWRSPTVPHNAVSRFIRTGAVKVDSTGRRNTSIAEVCMGRKSGWTVSTAGRPAVRNRNRQKEARLYRGQIPSQGAPTIAWREDRVRFWAAIARGLKTDVAGIEAGVSSPVAYRWFRHAGGVNPCLPENVSGRYLSFSEREDIAIWRAQEVGVREMARRLKRSPSTISRELCRNASTRQYPPLYKASTAQWHAERRAKRP